MSHLTSSSVQIEQGWKDALLDEFDKPYFAEIKRLLTEDRSKGITIYPSGPLIFNAFNLTPFDKVRVIILGQDPYHGAGQAHGLSFSVPKGVKPPPSLVNIFKEINNEFGYIIPQHGNLESWATQGVLLLNALLTVRANLPASHHHLGWKYFTNAVIETLSKQKSHLVFMLWGRFAQEKISLIDTSRHLVLTAAHPSPFSAYNGFFGCNHFKLANDYLIEHHHKPIDWRIE